MPNTSPTPEITVPRLQQADDILEFRTRIFEGELASHTDVSPAAIASHVKDWRGPEGRAAFTRRLDLWLRCPGQTFMRIITVGETVAGLCIGHLATLNSPYHFLACLQLDPSIRRQGHGRKLIEAFEARADPEYQIQLTVFEDNELAKPLYTRLGYLDSGLRTSEKIGNPPEDTTMITMFKDRRSTT